MPTKPTTARHLSVVKAAKKPAPPRDARIGATHLAYLAGILDSRGSITILRRKSPRSDMPVITIYGKDEVLNQMADATGTRVSTTKRNKKWSIAGAKATVVLAALRPHMRAQGLAADKAIVIGMLAEHKPAHVKTMLALGWPMPKRK